MTSWIWEISFKIILELLDWVNGDATSENNT